MLKISDSLSRLMSNQSPQGFGMSLFIASAFLTLSRSRSISKKTILNGVNFSTLNNLFLSEYIFNVIKL